MSTCQFETVVIAGIGLLGGSLGLRIIRNNVSQRVVGVGRNEERLKKARDENMITEYSLDLAEACSEAQLVILCTPVQKICEHLPVVMQYAPSGALITDVGSTKEQICDSAQQVLRELMHKRNETPKAVASFIGSHPMAGSEKSGLENAREDLYEGATCFITISGDNDLENAAMIREFWKSMGCDCVFTTPSRHDELVAVISHLPHFASVSLVEAIHSLGETPQFLSNLVGPGFQDTTRIAAGDPEMWLDIGESNRGIIVRYLSKLEKCLHDLNKLIQSGDREKLFTMLQKVQEYRREYDRQKRVESHD